MKRIVIYQSETGFTAQYAVWIAEELQCQAEELKKIKLKELEEYDLVVYGGWIFANTISGYEEIQKLNLKNLVVFGVGMSPSKKEVVEKILEQNGLKGSPFFYFEGGYRPGKLGLVKRMMMSMIRKSIEKKEEKTEEDLYMLETFRGADHTDRESIKELIQLCQSFK